MGAISAKGFNTKSRCCICGCGTTSVGSLSITSWLYSRYGKNFVKTILKKSEEQPLLKVVSDQVGTPTYAGDLAEFILTLLEPENLEKTGTYNYTDEGVCSWYDLACEVCDMSGNLCEVVPCETGEYPVKAARPHYSVLNKSKVKKTFGIEIPYWKDSLRHCMSEIATSLRSSQ